MALGIYFRTLWERYPTETGMRLTQGQLAEMVRLYNRPIGQSVVSKLETGEDTPGGDILAVLLDVLGGRLEDVVWIVKRDASIEEARRRAIEALAADIPTEGELERLIADWQADEKIRRSLRRVWRAQHSDRASTDEV